MTAAGAAPGAKAGDVEVLGVQLESQRVGQAPCKGPPLVLDARLERLLCLERAGNPVLAAIDDESRAGLDEGERHVVRAALPGKAVHPGKIARPWVLVVLAAANNLLKRCAIRLCPIVEVSGDTHWPNEGGAHDALVLGGRCQKNRDALVGSPLVFTSHVEHHILPSCAPIGRQTRGHALGALREDEELHVGSCADDAPDFLAPGIGLFDEEIRVHADADEFAVLHLVAA